MCRHGVKRRRTHKIEKEKKYIASDTIYLITISDWVQLKQLPFYGKKKKTVDVDLSLFSLCLFCCWRCCNTYLYGIYRCAYVLVLFWFLFSYSLIYWFAYLYLCYSSFFCYWLSVFVCICVLPHFSHLNSFNIVEIGN